MATVPSACCCASKNLWQGNACSITALAPLWLRLRFSLRVIERQKSPHGMRADVHNDLCRFDLSWPLRQESNLYLTLRRGPFYPLNYKGKGEF